MASKVNYVNIPAGLKVLPNWVLWKWGERDGKPTKIPIDRYGQNASTASSATWCHFDEAKTAFEQGMGEGIGFVFTRKNNITGVDLDHCRDKSTGEIDAWAKIYLDRLNTYSEVSPSGEGLHVIFKGALPEDVGVDGKRKYLIGDGYRPKAAIEMYCAGRFFTFTGQRAEDYPPSLESRQDELTGIFEELFPRKDNHKQPTQPNNNFLSDEKIIELATQAKNGDKFQRLMRGNTSGYQSDSEADSALCCILAYYTKDKTQIVRIVQSSGLWDKKWERPDYQD